MGVTCFGLFWLHESYSQAYWFRGHSKIRTLIYYQSYWLLWDRKLLCLVSAHTTLVVLFSLPWCGLWQGTSCNIAHWCRETPETMAWPTQIGFCHTAFSKNWCHSGFSSLLRLHVSFNLQRSPGGHSRRGSSDEQKRKWESEQGEKHFSQGTARQVCHDWRKARRLV